MQGRQHAGRDKNQAEPGAEFWGREEDKMLGRVFMEGRVPKKETHKDLDTWLFSPLSTHNLNTIQKRPPSIFTDSVSFLTS